MYEARPLLGFLVPEMMFLTEQWQVLGTGVDVVVALLDLNDCCCQSLLAV